MKQVPALLELLKELARLKAFEADAALALAILPCTEPWAVDQRFDFSARLGINLVVGPWECIVVFVCIQMLAAPAQGRPQALVQGFATRPLDRVAAKVSATMPFARASPASNGRGLVFGV